MVILAPMPSDGWNTWRAASIRGHARDMVRVGAWAAEGAEDRAAAEFARLVPDGQATPGHEFWSILSDTGETVGAIWFGPGAEVGHGAAFIWDIVIDEAHRGRGYGRAALEAVEPLARARGYDAIRLHVFGDNQVARHLYRSAGYEETDVSMRKRLGSA